MDKPHCIINPKTNRAVKIDSRLGKQILASQKNVKKEPHTPHKKPIGPVKPKEPNQMYKKKIGPVKPKEPNTQYKEHWKVGPNKFTLKNHQEKMAEDSYKLHRNRRDTQNLKERGDAYKKQVNDSFKNLVNEWDTSNIGILFYQIASAGGRENLEAMIRKIVNLEGKKKAIIPSELFAFLVNPLYKVNGNLLDLLVDEYGADKKGIDIIDEGMRNIIKHIEPNAILPDEIDYNYYSKHMNAKNKTKMSKMITDKYFKKKQNI
jgi:hypothetical protein